MAKIRYLINNNPYLSMVSAIKSENIVYSAFYNKFKELWGRLSTNTFSDEWSHDMALNIVDGIEVFGASRVYLFNDGEVDYKYTKEICKVIGASYDSLLSSRGDVESLYLDLSGLTKNLDFSDELLIENAMSNMVEIIEPYDVDSLSLSFVVDSEFDPLINENFTLSQLRGLSLAIDDNTADYIADLDLTPSIKYFTLPTALSSLNETTQETTYSKVNGAEINIDSSELYALLGTMGRYSDNMDAMFNSIAVSCEILSDRVIVNQYTEDVTYKRYKYTIEFNFESSVSSVDGSVNSLINWDYLASTSFSTPFAQEYNTHKTWYEQNTQEDSFGSYNTFSLSNRPYKEFLIWSAIVSYLDAFDDVDNIFYNKRESGFMFKRTTTYLRFDRLSNISNKEFTDLLVMSVYVGYVSKDSGGWFGGGFLGNLLEVVFVMVVVVVGIVLSILFWNPTPLAIAIGILIVASKYTNMSARGQGFAGFGIKVLGVAGTVMGLYDVYTIAYDLAIEEAGAELVAQGMSDVAVEEVAYSELVMNVSLESALKIGNELYGAFNLLAPVNDKVADVDSVEYEQSEDSAIYRVNSSYDFYDDVYNIYG
ncbi:MAG: hypothetical protein GQ570_15040 [Helicobacteraceae bacterium]|nr:hypothetical protein [Helicobacteraceae bacterium]